MGENYITCREEKGSINISEDVIISMVKSVLSEVEGVAGLSNTAGAESAASCRSTASTAGCRARMRAVGTILGQDKILSVVQATTGIENAEVNVHVSGIAFDK